MPFLTIPVQQTGISIRLAEFSFTQLYNWWKSLPQVFSIPGVVSIDLDERQNRLAVGVTNVGARIAVATELLSLGIPVTAVIIKDDEPTQMMASLRDRIRSIWGGLHLESPGTTFCTIGFNATRNGTPVFATNGHCTSDWGPGNESTAFWQNRRNIAANSIGNEILEARIFDSSEDSRCPSGWSCKYSDMALGSYSTSEMSVGYLNRPNLRRQYDDTLPTAAVINDSNPVLTIADEEIFTFVGETVEKIGRTTGWTFGSNITTCETRQSTDAVTEETFYFVCVNVADMGVFGGDSGSGVFKDLGAGSFELRGQLYGGSTFNGTVFTRVVWAPLNNIQSDTNIGDIVTTVSGF